MTTEPISIEVVMAAYNNEAVTRLALEGYLRQRDSDFSLVIADDGSGPATASLVEEFAARGLSIRHVWQEDRGFRKGRVLNKAIATSSADYLIFVDNDCIPQSGFIADHRHRARRGHFMAARRIDLGPELSDRFRRGEIAIERLDSRPWLLWQSLRHRLRHAEHGLSLPWPLVERWCDKAIGLLGANMAIWRDDLLAINGFDNDVPEGCGEETDLEWRLLAKGVEAGALLGRAGVAHLYHKGRKGPADAPDYRHRKIARNEVVALNGIREVADES